MPRPYTAQAGSIMLVFSVFLVYNTMIMASNCDAYSSIVSSIHNEDITLILVINFLLIFIKISLK